MAKIELNEDLSSQKANSVYLLKSENDTIVGILSLENGVDVNRYVANLQDYLFEIADTTGITGEGDPNRKVYSSINYIANGDSRKLAIEKLDAQSKVNADNIASNVLAIGVNAQAIQDIIDSKGQANGIAPLNANAKIDPIYLSDALLIYKGAWDASTNTPTLSNTDIDVENFWYRTNVAGTVDFGAGPITFSIGDKVVNNGTIWEKWDTTDEVISVAGKTGAVTLDSSDVGLENVTNDAQLKRAGNDWTLITEKENPVEDDVVLIEDSEDSQNKKRVRLENLLGGGAGGGGSFVWSLTEDISPLENLEGGIDTLDFDFESEMSISALFIVPSGYKAGDQIALENCYFFSAGSSDNVFFKLESTLFKTGEDITTPTNTSTSNNTEITLTSANEILDIGTLFITNNLGQINGVAVAPGDIIRVRLVRDNPNETTSSTEDARFLRYSTTLNLAYEAPPLTIASWELISGPGTISGANNETIESTGSISARLQGVTISDTVGVKSFKFSLQADGSIFALGLITQGDNLAWFNAGAGSAYLYQYTGSAVRSNQLNTSPAMDVQTFILLQAEIDDAVHEYEIRITDGIISFYQDDVLKHTVTADLDNQVGLAPPYEIQLVTPGALNSPVTITGLSV